MEEKPEYKAAPTEPSAVNGVIASEAKQSTGTEANDAQARIATLEAAVAEKDAALIEATKTLEARSSDLASLKTTHEAAVTAYRKLAVSSNPLFSEDLITGNTIAEVDASVKQLGDALARVRSVLEADIKSLSVPAGAPGRTAPDTSSLSPRDKIKAGLDKK